MKFNKPHIVQIEPNCYVDYNRKKVIKKGLAKGTVYASYCDRDCKVFSFWLSRSHIALIKSQQLDTD